MNNSISDEDNSCDNWNRYPQYTSWCGYFYYGVERKNPHKISELTRAIVLDNCNLRPCISKASGAYCNCCPRILSEKIDQLEIPGTEKMEIKKILENCNLKQDLKQEASKRNCNCCRRILSEKIDQLEIPVTEKMKIKKLIHLL